MPVSSLSHQAATGLGLQPACLSALWGSYHVLQQTHIIKQAPASGPHKARLSQNPWPLQPSSDFVVQPKRTLWLLPSPAISELAKIHHCDDSGSRPAHWYHLSVALGLSFSAPTPVLWLSVYTREQGMQTTDATRHFLHWEGPLDWMAARRPLDAGPRADHYTSGGYIRP